MDVPLDERLPRPAPVLPALCRWEDVCVRTVVSWLVAVLVLVILPAGASADQAPPFTTSAGQGPGFDGYAAGLPADGPLGLRWRRDLDGLAVGGADDVFVLRGGVELAAIDWATGLTRWSRTRRGSQLDPEFRTPAALANTGDLVIVVSGDELYARDAATGALRWSVEVDERDPRDVFATVDHPRIAVTRGTVVVQVVGGVSGFDLTDGRRLWTRELTGLADEMTFAVDGDAVVLATYAYFGCLQQAVDLRSGAERWRVYPESRSGCSSQPLATHDGVAVWADLRRVSDGAILRRGPGPFPPLFSGDAIFYGPYDEPLHDATSATTSDGGRRWTWDSGDGPEASTSVAVVGPRSVLTSRRDLTDPTRRTSLLQLLDTANGRAVGTPLRVEGGAGRNSTVVGDQEVLVAGDSVVVPGGSPVSFPGRRVVFAGQTAQPPAPEDPFDTHVRTPRPEVPFRLPRGDTDAECRADGGTWEACTSPWKTPDLGADGEHTVDVRHDPAAPAARLVVELDRQAPGLTITGGVSGTVGDGSSPFPPFEFASDDALATFECSVDGAPMGYCWSSQGVERVSGDHVLRVRSVDRNGNRSAVQERRWSIHLDPPTLTIGSPPRPLRTTDVVIPFTVSADAVTVTCRVTELTGTGSREASPTAPCSGSWRGTLSEREDRSSAQYRLLVTATDEYGNVRSEERIFDVDLPQLTYRRGDGEVVLARLATDGVRRGYVQMVADGDVSSDAECRLASETVWRRCDARADPGRGTTFITLAVGSQEGHRDFLVPESDGVHDVRVRGVDRWGAHGDEVRVDVLVDTTPPVVDFSGVPAVFPTAMGDAHFPLRIEDAAGASGIASMYCDITGDPAPGALGSAGRCDGTTYAGAVPPGDSILRVWVTDRAGNEVAATHRLLAGPEPSQAGGTTTTTSAPPLTTTTTTPATTTTTATTTTGTTTTGTGRPVTPAPTVPLPLPPAAAGPSPATGPSTESPASPAPCRASRASARGAPVVRSVVRRGRLLVVRATVPGASRRRPARVTLQTRRACGSWLTVRTSRTTRPSVRLTSPSVSSSVGAVRIRATIAGRTATSASHATR